MSKFVKHGVHNGMEFSIPFAWIAEAGASGFRAPEDAPTKDSEHRQSMKIAIEDIKPVQRAVGVPLLKKERTIKWLRRIASGVPIRPIQIAPGGPPYQVHNGAHRLYTTLITGHSHIWAVQYSL